MSSDYEMISSSPSFNLIPGEEKPGAFEIRRVEDHNNALIINLSVARHSFHYHFPRSSPPPPPPTRKLGEYQWRKSQQFAEGRRVIRLMLGTRGQRGSKRVSSPPPSFLLRNEREKAQRGTPVSRLTKSRRGQPFCLRGPILTRLPRENGGGEDESN